jgi:hypothetical protein
MPCTIEGVVMSGSDAASPTPQAGVVVSLRPVTGTLLVGGVEVVGPWPEDVTGVDGTYSLSAYRADESDPPVDWVFRESTGLALQGQIPNTTIVTGGAAALKDTYDWVPVQDAGTGPVTVIAGPRGLPGASGIAYTNELAAESYSTAGSGSFANGVTALAALGEAASLVISDEHVLTDSLTSPANVLLSFTGKGHITVQDTPHNSTLLSAWGTTTTAPITGTATVPVTAVPVVSTAGMNVNDTAILFAIDANGATSLVPVTIGTIDSGTQFSTTSLTSIKQTIQTGATVRNGYKSLVTQVRAVSVAGLQVGDEYIIADDGQTIYSSVMGGVYTPDTGECLQIAAIDTGTNTLTFTSALQQPHTNEATIGRRKLWIRGPVAADPARWIFTANRDGVTGRIEMDAATQSEVYVEWFGAKPDASTSPAALGTDSTAAIQAAYMAPPAHGGIDIKHAGSQYRITAPLMLHHSSKWGFRDSMRIIGRAPQNDQLTAGPTSYIWSGTVPTTTDWTAMLELFSRNCVIEGIWFNVAGSSGTPFRVGCGIKIDRANASVTCTANHIERCNFGDPNNYLNGQMFTGIVYGRRNHGNSDFMDHERLVFFNMMPDAVGTVGTACGVYVGNTTDQHKRHMYKNCDYRGTLIGPGTSYYGYKTMRYGLYYASGSFTTYENHYYSVRTRWYVGSGTNNIIEIGGDSENVLQHFRDDSTAAGTIFVSGTRFGTGAITGNPAPGDEAIKTTAAAVIFLGNIMNPGTERSYNDAYRISAGGVWFDAGCQFPSPEPFDLTAKGIITSLSARGTSGGENNGSPIGNIGALTRNLRRRFLQGNYLDGSVANDGGLWVASPLAAAVGGGTYKLTPPGVVRIMNLPPKATVITTPSGGTSVPASAFLWYGMTRITASGTERPTGVAVPVQAGATSQVVLNPPAAYESGDTGFNIYRAVGTDLTTAPAATAFRRITSGVTYSLPRGSTDALYITDDHADVSANAVMPNVDVTPPTASPTLSNGASTGQCTPGSHVVAFSNVTTAGTQTGPLTTGESFVGPVGATYTVSASGEKVHVAGIPTVGGAVAGHSIYMSKAGTRFPLYWAGWVADGAATFDIAALDAALTARGPQAIPAGFYYYCSTSKTRDGGTSGIFVIDKAKMTLGLPGLPVLRMPPYLPGSTAYGIERTRQGEASSNTASNYFELDTIPSLPTTAVDIASTYIDFAPDDWITNLAPPSPVLNTNAASTAIPEILSVLGGDAYFGGNVTVAGSLVMSGVPPHGSSHAPYGTDPVYLDHGNAFQNALEVLPNGRLYGMHDSLTMVAGTLYVFYFTPETARTITQMIVALSAVFAGQNYLEALLYTVGATDSALTEVLRSGNLSATALTTQAAAGGTTTTNTGMTATGLYALPFGSSYAIARGTRYAVGLVSNAATTMGKFAGHLTTTGGGHAAFSTGTFGGVANLLYPVLTKQFANGYTAAGPAPTSHGAASGAGNGNLIWSALG